LIVTVLALATTFAVAAEDAAHDLPPGDSPPPTVFERIASAGTADDHDGADHVIVYDRTVNRVKSSGVTYTDGYVLYKVLTPAGCRNQSVQRWRYEPWSSFVDVREVNVIRGDERIPVDVALVHELPAPQSGIYWNAAIKTLQLPRLRVNDGIELRVFRKGYSYALLAEDGGGTGTTPANHVPDDDKYIPPMPGEYFDIVLFQSSVPIVQREYVLWLPSDKRLHSEIYNAPLYSSTTYSADSTRYSWWAHDVPPRPSEPRAAGWSDVVPKVVVATVESWEAKSRWFFDVNEGQFEVTPEIQAKVEEIFADAGLTDADEERKAEALVHWVAQNIRYSGQTMGEGEGFTLHSGAMIFEQRSGVCKDIAGMLVTMMRAAGMDSYAAMTMAGTRIETTPADQFNHCVTALRKADGGFEMYDPTWVPYMNDIWSKYETEQQYLIGSREGHGLASIDYSPPEESPLFITHDAVLSEDGTLTGALKLSGARAMDSRLRNLVSGGRILDVEDDIARLLSNIGNRVEISRLEYVDVDDFSENAWIEVDYRIPGFALPVGEGLEFASPMMSVTMGNGWLFRAGAYDWADEREGDLFLWFTQLIDGRETIRLPRGYEVVDPPASDEVDETYASFKGESEMDGRDLVITQYAEVRRRQIPPDGYAGFKTALDEAHDWAEHVYRAEKGGER
jgi:transglutaminase-like putative cysteine protease